MLNGKYTKIDRIIEGVFRDYGWTHEIDWVDALEWVGECMDLIAAPKQYINKVTDGNDKLDHPCAIVIKDYKGSLPCDIIQINQVREFNTKIEMRYTTDTFQKGLSKNEANIPDQSLTSFGTINFSSPLIKQQQMVKDSCLTDLSYMITDQHIFCNFEEGEVEMAYTAFPTDKNGYPLIPDNVKYIQAVKSYLAERIGFKMFIQGKLNGQVYGKLEQERAWYIGAATTAGLQPSIDEMESWKNQMVRLIPSINQHGNSFRYHGDKPGQINHNSV
jgi:hypothetical protein